jgi:transmembrane sensor
MTTPSKPSAATAGRDAAIVETATAWFVRMTSDLVTAEDRRAFREWCERDPAHPAAYAEAAALWSELGAIPDPRQRPGARGGAPAATAAARPAGRPSRRPWLRRFGALAAGLLLAAVLGLWSLGGYERLAADYATAVGERLTVTLADGSVLHLNTDTALAVDVTAEHRRVRLYRGEAYFAVAHDRSRPFEVDAADGIVRAVGTAFDVRRDGEAVTVAVAEGRVEVRRNGPPKPPGESVLLGPGEGLHYTAGAPSARRRVDVNSLTAWRQGRLVFADRPLRAVVAELDRYRPGAIVFLTSAIAEERFSGVVSLADTDQALAAIESTLPVDVIRLTGYLTVLRARN